MSEDVRAISFDVDGTLYSVGPRSRFAKLVLRDVRRIVRQPRWQSALAPFRKAREQAREDADAEVAFRERVIGHLMNALGCDRETAAHTHDWMTDAIAVVGTRGKRPFRGVRRAIVGAVRAGLRVGVVSDYDPRVKLANLGLLDLPWSAIVACDALGRVKPSAAPFLHFAERVGVPPSAILHVGDREDTDVAGALAAGMRVWRYSSEPNVDSRAEHVFSRWHGGTFAGLGAR